MSNLDYIGFDVHKKSISFCAKARDGRILDEGKRHGAGRAMSRNEAKRRFTVEDHIRMTEGVECRKDED